MAIPPQFDPMFDPNTGRKNGFIFPHKGFRRMWLTVVGKVDATDWSDQEEVKEVVPLVQVACNAYQEHNELETKHFLSALKPHAEEVCEKWLGEHTHHIAELKEISASIKALSEIADDTERRKQGIKWSDKLHLFLASDLHHMSFEENVVTDLMNKHLSAEEFEEAENRLLRELNPAFMRSVSPFFLLGGDTNSVVFLANVVLRMTAQAPPQAWTGFCNLAKSILSPKALAKAQQRCPALDGNRR
jgi:hypothetical protein